jgi:protein-S-isoprenylcysteine O-methyltransferase Ste14
MEKQVLPGLKIAFLVHCIVAAFFGFVLLLVPEFMGTISGQPIVEPIAYRGMGAAILAFAASSWWANKENSWDKVKIVVQMELVWTSLFVLVFGYGIISGQLPPMDWMNVAIVGGFGITFAVFYFQH